MGLIVEVKQFQDQIDIVIEAFKLGPLVGVDNVFQGQGMEADLLRTPAADERALGVPILGAIPDSPAQKDAATASARPQQVGSPETS